MTFLLAVALALSCAAPPPCDPPCASGQTCGRVEACYDVGCSERWVCEGTPDDCRTNGCPDDHHDCQATATNQYVCVERACASRPEYVDCFACWTCHEWAIEKDCCLEWRYRGSEEP